ncbi:MAG: SRPBCC family protein [Candidatus Promineifilaceae bacterium]
MAKYEHSVWIDRPVGEVFKFATKPENEPKWNAIMQESEITSEGPMGVGTTVRSVSRVLGRAMETTWEVVDYEVNRRKAVKSTSGPIPLESIAVFEPVEGGTKLTFTLRTEAGGIFKLIAPIIFSMGKRQTEQSFINLKKLLETHSQPS